MLGAPAQPCRTGCPRHGCAPPASGGWPGIGAAIPRGWRSGRPCRVRPAPVGRADSRSRRPGAPPAGRAAPRRCQGLKRLGQQPVVAAVGHRRDRAKRDAARVGDDRAFQALLATIGRAGSGDLAAAGRLGDAAVHRQMVQLQPEDPPVGAKYRQAGAFGQPEGDPLVAAAPQGGRRAGGIGAAALATAKHQDLDELVEQHPAGDAGAVAAKGMVDLADRQQRGELDPQRSRIDDGRAGTRPPVRAEVRARRSSWLAPALFHFPPTGAGPKRFSTLPPPSALPWGVACRR
jgi:hypothetical protein